jgi:O-antigen/teichoic acid export membrane protein
MPGESEAGATAGNRPPISKVRESSFAGDAAKLAGGAVLAQALGILVAPILSRLFAPEAFGTAALFKSIIQVIGVFACLGYERAILLPEENSDASSLLAGSLLIAGGIALLTAVATLLLGGAVVTWLQAPALTPFLWLLPLAVLAYGISLALRFWHTRTKHFGLLSSVQMVSATSQAAVKLGAGFLGFTGSGSLIGAGVVGQAVSAVSLGWHTSQESSRRHLRTSWNRIAQQLWRYRKFPLLSTWSGLLNTLSLQLPILLLSAFFTQTIVGYFAFGMRVVGLPMTLLGNAVGQVFLQRASVAYRNSTLGVLVEDAIVRLAAVGIYPMLLLTLVGQDLFAIVFGTQWTEAGVYVQILSLWRLMVFIGSPITVVYLVMERQGAGLFVNLILLLSRLASLAVGGQLGNPRLALLLYAGVGVLIWVGLLAWLIWLSAARFRRVLSGLAAYFIFAIPGLTALSIAKWWMQWPVFAVFGVAALGGLLNYALVFAHDPEIREGLLAIARRVTSK